MRCDVCHPFNDCAVFDPSPLALWISCFFYIYGGLTAVWYLIFQFNRLGSGQSLMSWSLWLTCYFAVVGMRNIVMSMSVCVPVCLSARITRKPRGQASPNSCVCCLWQWLGPPLTALRYVMYFRFCGWRHIYIMSNGALCVFLSGDRTRQAYSSRDSNQILLNDKDRSRPTHRGMKPAIYDWLVCVCDRWWRLRFSTAVTTPGCCPYSPSSWSTALPAHSLRP